MSEIDDFPVNFAQDLNQALDKVLPYQPYERTALDIALIEEADLAVGTRLRHVSDELDAENITNGMLRSARAEELYAEHYPQAEWSDDLEFYRYGLTNPRALKVYGSVETQNRIEVTLGSKYPYTAKRAVMECVARKFTTFQAANYLHAVSEFTQDLHNISFISKDELLHAPLLQLGVRLAYIYDVPLPNFAENFNTYLKEKVIGHENLVGEDGQVSEDMTESLYEWVEARVDEYVERWDFRLPQVYGYDEEAIEEDRFTVYGSDAAYFREIERRRLEKESAVARRQ